MIIQCDKCGTRFRVADEKIGPQGIKARCARCKQVFFATAPEPPAEDHTSEPLETGTDQPSEDTSSHRDFAWESEEEEPHEVGATQADQPPESQEAESEPPIGESGLPDRNSEEDWPEEQIEGFGNERVFSTGDSVPETSSQHEPEEDGSFGEFSFGLSPEHEEEEFGTLDESEKLDTGEDFKIEPIEEEGAEKIEEGLEAPSAEEDTTEEEGPMFIFEEPDVDQDKMLDETAPLEEISTLDTETSIDDEEADQPPSAPQTTVAPPRKSPVASLMIFFLIVLIVLTAVTGYLFWRQGPQAFERILIELTGEQSRQAIPAGRIELTDYTASFVTNQRAGELFVIRGRARNLYNEARSSIQVKGVIFNEENEPVMQQTVFGGNPLTDEQIKTLPYDELEEAMNNQFGNALSNLNVKPGSAIPFTVIFRNLPEGVAEFTVEVVDSRPATAAESDK